MAHRLPISRPTPSVLRSIFLAFCMLHVTTLIPWPPSCLSAQFCFFPLHHKLVGRSTMDFLTSLWGREGKAVPTMTVNKVITDNVKKLPATSSEKIFGFALGDGVNLEHSRYDLSTEIAGYQRAHDSDSWRKTVFRHTGDWIEVYRQSNEEVSRNISKMLVHGIDTWAPKIPIKKVVVEFPSSIVGMGMHMGHARSAAVGESLCRMLEFSHVKVLRQNHLDDWSSELGLLIEFLLEKFQNWDDETQITFADLEKSRMDAWARYMEDPIFRERAHEAVICLKSGSFYQAYVPDVLEKLRINGLVQECRYGRALMFGGVDTPCEKEVILESDVDSFSRASIDLAALWYRLFEEKAEWIIYVGNVADFPHFCMLSETARHAGWLPSKTDSYPGVGFFGFDHVYRKDGRISRSLFDESERLVDLLDEAKARSKATLVQLGKNKEWKERELEQMAESIGCVAIKYTKLAHGQNRYVFNFDEVLNRKGKTAVNHLNALAWLCSIIMNSGKDIEALKRTEKITFHHGSETALARCLLDFGEAVECACGSLCPAAVSSYLHKLRRFLKQFKENCPVRLPARETLA